MDKPKTAGEYLAKLLEVAGTIIPADLPFSYSTNLPIECLAPTFKEVFDYSNYQFEL